jgi:hypothetical protein
MSNKIFNQIKFRKEERKTPPFRLKSTPFEKLSFLHFKKMNIKSHCFHILTFFFLGENLVNSKTKSNYNEAEFFTVSHKRERKKTFNDRINQIHIRTQSYII